MVRYNKIYYHMVSYDMSSLTYVLQHRIFLATSELTFLSFIYLFASVGQSKVGRLG